MDLQIVEGNFVVCKVEEIDASLLNKKYVFLGTTDSERSIICKEEMVPEQTIICEHGWLCFRIAEDASFEKYGMIAFLSEIIAAQKTSILCVGTYDTDYIFIKEEKMAQVKQALCEHDCRFI